MVSALRWNARLQRMPCQMLYGPHTPLSAWKDEKWMRPDLQEDFDLRQVDLKLWMVSLFPPEAIEYMRHLLGDKFDGLSSDEQAVLVTAYLEEEINSPRIQTLLDKNVLEVGRILFHLMNLGYLVSAGRGRGTTYSVTSAPVSNTNGDLSIINEVPSNTNGDLSNINGHLDVAGVLEVGELDGKVTGRCTREPFQVHEVCIVQRVQGGHDLEP